MSINPPIPTFRIRTSEYNRDNLRDLAGSLFQAISSICHSGACINYLNVNTLNVDFLNASGANLINLTGVNESFTTITGTNVFFTNETTINETVTNLTGTNAFFTNKTVTNLTGTNAFFTNLTDTNLAFTNSAGTNLTVTNLTVINITGNAGAVPYAEFAQTVTGTNNSIIAGRAVSFNTQVVNTAGITTNAGPGGQGTEFVVPVGTYFVNYETSNNLTTWSMALYKSNTGGLETIDTNTLVGASTAGMWMNGSSVLVAQVPTYVIVSPGFTGAAGSIGDPTTGSSPLLVSRITFMKIA
jgi:hypothetical protein